MFTLFQTWTRTYFSGAVIGGVRGRAAGIVHVTMTGDGLIMTVSQVFILMSTRVGEDTTETIVGTTTAGTTNEFPTIDFKGIGGAGMINVIGEGKEPGASRAIEFRHSHREKS